MGKGPKRGHFSRSRSLQDFNAKFSKNILENTIRKTLEKNKKVRVLEIGCGEGRVLMELRKLFPNLELYGINKTPWSAMKGSESLIRTAKLNKIFTLKEIKKVKLPKIYFYYARKLKFKENYFDLVYSQVAIQYIDRKDQVLEEVWRVLKKDGKAFLNMDTYEKGLPDYLQYESPRFIIYKNNKYFSPKTFFNSIKKKGFDIQYNSIIDKAKHDEGKKRINIVMNKNTAKRLKLNLKFDEQSSFDQSKLHTNKIGYNLLWGYRSVFRA